jgi:hypothetical protein
MGLLLPALPALRGLTLRVEAAAQEVSTQVISKRSSRRDASAGYIRVTHSRHSHMTCSITHCVDRPGALIPCMWL